MTDLHADVVVIGSGAAGLTAAFVAAKQGLKVTLLEATNYYGGTTAYSGGGVWIPANHYQREAGIKDDLESAKRYCQAILKDTYDPALISAYIDTAAEMLDFMESTSELKLSASTIPDYEPGLPDWKISRCLLTEDFDGRRLGHLFSQLRPPIKEMGLLHSLQLSPATVVEMRSCFTSWRAFIHTTQKFCRYFVSRVVHGRGASLANGNALAGRLLKSASDAGVTLMNNSRAKKLLSNDEGIYGVEYEHKGESHTLLAKKGVILASGGFGANEAMRSLYVPQTATGYSLQPEGNQGDGITMAQECGAVFQTDNVANAIWVPASRCVRDDGSLATFPSLFFDRHCPGSIMVDAKTGKRFLNEGFHYQYFGEVCAGKGVDKIWMLADDQFVRNYGIGMAKPWPFSLKKWLDNGYLIRADTIEALAEKTGMDSVTLRQTIANFNHDATLGKDSEFDRGGDYYSAYMGDAEHQPNPGLAPLVKAPFYALDVRPSDLCSLAGLKINAQAQVLTRDDVPIKGLYAAGIDANTVMRGYYPGGGTSLGPAMTFGYIAANHIAQQ